MSEFTAIIIDTWRQSKKQVVFVILAALAIAIAILAVVAATSMDVVVVEEYDSRMNGGTVKKIISDNDGLVSIARQDDFMGAGSDRGAPYVAVFESREDAKNAAKQLVKNAQLSGNVAINSEDNDLVFGSVALAREARNILAADNELPADKLPVHKNRRLIFEESLYLEQALSALRESPLNRPNSEFSVRVDRRFAFIWSDEPVDFLSTIWVASYIAAEQQLSGDPLEGDSQERTEETERRLQDVIAENAKGDRIKISSESYLYLIMWVIFTLFMVLFIAAAAGYFPDMLASGAVDVVLASPVGRFKVFFGKYLGGLVLFAALVLLVATVLFVGLGLRLDIWNPRIYNSALFLIFAGAVMNAILTLLGVISRSTALGIVIGMAFYTVVDTLISLAINVEQMGGFTGDFAWAKDAVKIVRISFPNFGLLKNISLVSVMNLPYLDLKPIVTAGAWLAGCLGLGYWKFRKSDY